MSRIFVFFLASLAVVLCRPTAYNSIPQKQTPNPESWNAAFKASVTEGALQKLAAILLTVVNGDLNGLKVPDYSTSTHVPVIGTVNIYLTSIVLQSADCSNVTIATTSSSSLTASISNVNAKISANYKYKQKDWPHIGGSGSVDITPDAGLISAAIGLSTLNSQAHVQVQTVNCDISHFSIKFHGSWLSWLYDLVADLLNHDLKKSIDNAVQNEIATVVNIRLNALLAKIPLVEKLGSGDSQMDLYLNVTELTTQSAYATVGMLMQVADPLDYEPCPFSPVAMPDTSSDDNYLQFFLADAVVGCMSYYLFMNDALDFICNPTLTHWFPLLNTSDWKLFIPQLYNDYPDMALQFEFYAQTPPTFQFVSTQVGAAASAGFAMNISVINETSLVYTLTLILNAQGSLDITAGMKGGNATLFANLTSMDLNLTVGYSELGPLDPVVLEAIAAALGPALMKAVNLLGSMGFPLPTLDGLTILNPHILYNDGYITVSSDFNYTPPPPKHGGESLSWQCNDNDLSQRQICTRVHETVLEDKTVFWAEAQDVSSGVVVRGFETDTPETAVILAVGGL